MSLPARRLLVLICFALLHSLAARAQSAVYHDSDLHFAFNYPEELKVNEAVGESFVPLAKAKVTGDANATKAMNCLQMKVVAVEAPRTSNFRMLSITSLDLNCNKEKTASVRLNANTGAALSTAMTMLGRPTIGKPLDYKVAGHLASVVEGSIEPQASMSKGPIYGAMVCAIIEHNEVCFSALSADRPRVMKVLEGSITFDGSASQPLIPTGFLPK